MPEYTIDMHEECGGDESITVEAPDDEAATKEAETRLRKWVRQGAYGDEGARVSAHWTLFDEEGEEINDGSLDVEIEPNHEKLIRNAGGNPDCDHDWTSKGEGGCRENPGVWSTGGTSFSFASHCRKCGLHRTEHTTGSQYNPGEHDEVVYSQPDSWCAECEREECICSEDD